MFLNPALEHEAVQKALDIAKQCTWTKWEKGPVWEDLKSLTITVPPPKTAKGYGLAVGRAEVFVKTAAAAAAAHVKDFEAGKITIDELMKLLNTQIETDRTGDGAAFVPRAKVVLERSDTAETTKWVPKTYFPSSDEPAGNAHATRRSPASVCSRASDCRWSRLTTRASRSDPYR